MTGPWRKSSFSDGQGGNCVEARLNEHAAEVRDSSLGGASAILSLTRTGYGALLHTVRRK